MKAPNRQREVQLKFRVTRSERTLIEQKMEQLGTTNMAAYLRKMAVDGYVVHLELPELREMRTDCSACVTVIWAMLKKAGFPIEDRLLSTALYYGLYMDTQKFKGTEGPDREMLDSLHFDWDIVFLLQSAALELGGHILQPLVRRPAVHGVHDGHLFVQDQVGVVGHAVGGPGTGSQKRSMVVSSAPI